MLCCCGDCVLLHEFLEINLTFGADLRMFSVYHEQKLVFQFEPVELALPNRNYNDNLVLSDNSNFATWNRRGFQHYWVIVNAISFIPRQLNNRYCYFGDLHIN